MTQVNYNETVNESTRLVTAVLSGQAALQSLHLILLANSSSSKSAQSFTLAVEHYKDVAGGTAIHGQDAGVSCRPVN